MRTRLTDHLASKFAGFSDPIAMNRLHEAVSAVTRNYGTHDRFAWQRNGSTGVDPDPRRSLEDEFGWPIAPDPTTYDRLYNWDTIGARVVALPPLQSWRVDPKIYETEDETVTAFEESVDEFVASLRGENNWYRPDPEQGGNPFFSVLRRGDVLSRRCRYGVVWYGFDDEEDPGMPVTGLVEKGSLPMRLQPPSSKGGKATLVKEYADPGKKVVNYSIARNAELKQEIAEKGKGNRKLLFMRPFPESQAYVTRWEANRNSPRFCQPLEYNITTLDPGAGFWGAGMPTTTQRVHWTRVVHIADTFHHATSSDVLATPAMQVPLYDVLDARKISGAGPEAFYRNAFTRLFFETIPQLGADVLVDDEALRDMMEEMENGSQRHGRLTGMHANPVSPTVVDPNPHVDAKLKRIAIHLSKPKRIFEGSERGELSSDQDEKQDAADVRGRQERYCSESIIAPAVNRLIMVGVLAEPGPDGFKIEWPDGGVDSDSDQADVFMSRMTAFSTAVGQGGSVVDLIGEKKVYEEAGYSDDEAQQLVDEHEKRQAEEEDLMAQQAQDARDQQAQDIADGIAPDPNKVPPPHPGGGFPPKPGGKPPFGGAPPFGGGKPNPFAK